MRVERWKFTPKLEKLHQHHKGHTGVVLRACGGALAHHFRESSLTAPCAGVNVRLAALHFSSAAPFFAVGEIKKWVRFRRRRNPPPVISQFLVVGKCFGGRFPRTLVVH